MRMVGWRTRAVFDRNNVVAEDDVREAARRLQAAAVGGMDDIWTRSSEEARRLEGPAQLGAGEAFGFSGCGGGPWRTVHLVVGKGDPGGSPLVSGFFHAP